MVTIDLDGILQVFGLLFFTAFIVVLVAAASRNDREKD